MNKYCLTALCIIISLTASLAEDVVIRFTDLKGARRIDTKTGYWEIGFGGHDNLEKIRSLPDLQGILKIKEGKIEGIQEGQGFELPGLNIAYDLRVYGRMTNIADHAGVMLAIPNGLLNSRNLTGQDATTWKAEALAETAKQYAKGEYCLVPATWFEIKGKATQAKDAALSLQYIDKNGNKVPYAVAIDPAYVDADGSTRIGFFNIGVSKSWYITRSCYIIQATKTKARIIGKITVDPLEDVLYTEKIAVAPESIRLTIQSVEPFTPSSKLIHNLAIYTTATDFEAFELSRLANITGLTPGRANWVPVSLWSKYPEEIGKMKADAASAQQGIDNLHKYGVKVILGWRKGERLGIYPEIFRKEFPQFIAERLTKDGKFVPIVPETEIKGQKLVDRYKGWDLANPEAMAFFEAEFGKVLKELYHDVDYILADGEWRFFRPYNYLEIPFYSQAALANYRKFMNDPKAKFPTAAEVPETERTFNTPKAEDWKKYYEWRNKVHTDFFIHCAKAGWDAFHGDPRYQGAMVVDSAGIAQKDTPHGVNLEDLFASQYCTLFIPEYPKTASDPVFQIWHNYAKKYNKKLINLADDYMINNNVFFHEKGYVKGVEKNLVMLFRSAGVECPTDGYSSLGNSSIFNMLTYPSVVREFKLPATCKNIVWPLWRALIKKYYGYGDMPMAEAEQRIEDALKTSSDFKPEGKKQAAIQLDRKITVDGNKDDWDLSSETQVINDKGQVFMAPDKWAGAQDASCRFALAADKENIYLAVDVQDDKFFPAGKLVNSKYGDEVNLYLSFADPQKDAMFMSINCFQFRLLPEKDQVYIGESPVAGSRLVCKPMEHGYFMEVAIPLANFKYTPKKGDMICADLSFMDADDEKGVKTTLIWNARYKPWNGPLMENGWGVAVIE